MAPTKTCMAWLTIAQQVRKSAQKDLSFSGLQGPLGMTMLIKAGGGKALPYRPQEVYYIQEAPKQSQSTTMYIRAPGCT